MLSLARLVLVALCVLLPCATGARADPSPSHIRERIAPALWKESNHGRVPLREDGSFAFPSTVKRVVVDVGAYQLRRTSHLLRGARGAEVGLVAVEPLAEAWKTWPDDPRIVGVPAAISLERGTLRFHVNAKDVTSSLLETAKGGLLSSETVEVRDVPGLRLEDVLKAIPEDLPVELLKTDVQGMDLAVLMSAGGHLRRVKEVRSEIVNDPSYVKDRAGSMASEKEFHEYMASQGFSVSKEIPSPERWIVDVFYENDHWETAKTSE